MRAEIFLGIAVATGVLSVRFVLTDRPVFTIIAMAVALLWLAGTLRRWASAGDAGLVLFTLLTIVALLAGPNSVAWSLPPLLGAVVAWNAGHLHRLMSDSDHIPQQRQLLRGYHLRLYGTLGVGTGMLVITLLMEINLNFAAAAALALLGMLGLSQAIRFLSRTGN